jgi:hypothetical protein
MTELEEHLRLATAIADRAVVALIECECIREERAGAACYDTRPLLDPREQSPQCIDMNTEELRYAALRGLIRHHTLEPHLVHIQHNSNTAP